MMDAGTRGLPVFPLAVCGLIVSFAIVFLLLPGQELVLLTFAFLLAGLLITARVTRALMHPLMLCFLGIVGYSEVGLIIDGFQTRDFKYPFLLAAGLFCLALGGLVCERLLPDKAAASVERFRREPFRDRFPISPISLYVLWGLGLAAFLYMVYEIGLPVLSDDPYIRYQTGGTLNAIAGGFWTWACVGLLVLARKLHSRRLYFMTAVFTTASVVLLSLLLYRYAQLELLLVLLIAYFYLFPVSTKTFLGFGIAAGGLFFSIEALRDYLLYGSALDLAELLTRTQGRLFNIGAVTLTFLFDYFPNGHPFFHGLTYVRVLHNLYYPDNPIPYIGRFIFSNLVRVGRWNPGYTPISIEGEFYVNFGFVGMILGMLFWGFAVQWISSRILAKKTSYRAMFFSILGMSFARSFAYSIPGLVYNLLLGAAAVAILLTFGIVKSRSFSPSATETASGRGDGTRRVNSSKEGFQNV